jgi:enamine deaminase RidA (YjgF/YER057c/UK114 family)
MKALGLVLPEARAAIGSYAPFLHLNGLLFISGQLPLVDGKVAIAGKVGAELDLARGQEAARLCALNILSQAKAALHDLDRIVQLMRLNGFVNANPGFADHPKVLNGASDLMVAVLGNKGLHTRIAVGCASLPLNAAVEVDAIFAVD